jgi:hypothetical protein
MESAGSVLSNSQKLSSLKISKQKIKKVRQLEVIHERRETKQQDIGFAARAFIYCGLPYRKPPANTLKYRKVNGQFVLEIRADSDWGLPFGQDRLIPIFVATEAIRQNSQTIRFSAGAEILDAFGLPNSGASYRRLMEGFNRIFEASIFFGLESESKDDTIWSRKKRGRFNYLDSIDLWYSKDKRQANLPGEDFQNIIQLSDRFWRDLQEHKTPVDLDVVRQLCNAPAVLDLFTWLSLRCHNAKDFTHVPLFGETGLCAQLGTQGYSRPRKFREKLEHWLDEIRLHWADCPAVITPDGGHLAIGPAKFITTQSRAVNQSIDIPR